MDKIYTLVGDILIAINPFKWIPGLYGVEVMMAQSKGKTLSLTLTLTLTLTLSPGDGPV